MNYINNNLSMKSILICSLYFYSFSCYALQGNDLTSSEWVTWPDYCKAAFINSGWARNTPYEDLMPREWVSSIAKKQGGTLGIRGLHHLCIGMVYVNRGRVADKKKSAYWLNLAIKEIKYSHARTPKGVSGYSLINAYLGKAYYHIGKRNEAVRVWQDGITSQPGQRESYLAMVNMLIEEEKFNEALELLLDYDIKKTVQTPDAEYFLAHVYMKLGRYKESRKHAEAAYALGYPFPGLLERLNTLEAK